MVRTVTTHFGEKVRTSSFIGRWLHVVRWKQLFWYLLCKFECVRGCVWKPGSQRDGLCQLLICRCVNPNACMPCVCCWSWAVNISLWLSGFVLGFVDRKHRRHDIGEEEERGKGAVLPASSVLIFGAAVSRLSQGSPGVLQCSPQWYLRSSLSNS